MSSTDDARTAAEGPARPFAGRNRAAEAGAFLAPGAVASLAGIAWIDPGVFAGPAVPCAPAAVPAGPMGRFRGRRVDGGGRRPARVGTLTGRPVSFVRSHAPPAFVGPVAGLVALTGRA